jgi:hypothetical protein
MNYSDGLEVRLGDLVSVPVPNGNAIARVIMLGDSREHLDIDPDFLEWVQDSDVLRSDSVVIEWEGVNPLAHDGLSMAPVGNYMFTPVDEWTELKARATA